MSILELLEIKHPIFLAPMAGVSTPELAAEVSNQGAFGSLGLGANTPETAKAEILKTQKLTDKPFQVNFFCHQPERLDPQKAQQWIEYIRPQFAKFGTEPPSELRCIYPSFLDNDDFLNVVLETRPKAVSFHFGIPHPRQIQALKDAGIVTLVSATNLIEAQQIEAAGIDIIIAQGIEAGGHRGIFNQTFDAAIKTSDLVQLISTHCKLPVVAAGGIMNGDQAKSMLKLGAAAVQLGTAFVQCKSSSANAAYRKALFSQSITQISSSLSGRPARGLFGAWHKFVDAPQRPNLPEYPYTYDIAKQLISIANQQQDTSYGAFWAGSNVGQIRELEAADLINQLVLEIKTH
ncbi:nitronate monooxygenase [Acinetobacter haemolyticus]|uniref:Nitronate monooxygenase n=1 Tax=Acinetobacter haemolyticus TaxID=29430 RepID=A0AAJ3D8J7_ACIHA|nr:nitronate monooxygenase [Acinetobacter haemolyticus]NAR17449.1 nitronate monooxygenase [Acinetobacter haemolyticus]NAR29362.1 nitronate monooxygenase [Acinetobacter haemolyticus]NAR35419.1 nitronate monooxygenase [Acinetobacter haemolyticus]NAR46322.1 nitronate monooxygenase [Acinetobacter haemolyticus]NAR62850.1 nitronate monooxygenase [Acinetobacter haemolyticus]